MIRTIATAAIVALSCACQAVAADTYAIDGDTIVIDGEHIRIANIDAPEIGTPKCDAEFRLGEVAKARMTELLKNGAITFLKGDHGRMTDRYGRSLGRIIVDGKDVGDILIAEGLARRWDGKRHPWCK